MPHTHKWSKSWITIPHPSLTPLTHLLTLFWSLSLSRSQKLPLYPHHPSKSPPHITNPKNHPLDPQKHNFDPRNHCHNFEITLSPPLSPSLTPHYPFPPLTHPISNTFNPLTPIENGWAICGYILILRCSILKFTPWVKKLLLGKFLNWNRNQIWLSITWYMCDYMLLNIS